MGYSCGLLLLLLTAVLLVSGESLSRTKREAANLEPGNWDSCKPNAPVPPTRVPTQDWVAGLRQYFATEYIEAYIIPNEDAHQSEYPSAYDKRRGFISGFMGSAGTAVITTNKSALWTDGRYFIEAEDTLDCGWILMRQGETGVPSIADWLKSELKSGNRVGANPFLISNSGWKAYADSLQTAGITMREVQDELIDKIWTNNRPPQPNTDINALPLQFSGRSWQDKVSDVRDAMAEKDVDMMVVTGLDETAWLFNLRASDIAYNPFFISYAIVEKDAVRLYLLDHLNKIAKQPSDAATNETVAQHLNTNNETGSCQAREAMCVEVKRYAPDTVIIDVYNASAKASKVWLSYACNYAIFSQVDSGKIYQANTPIATSKTKKNPTEVAGMKAAHIRDASAVIAFVSKLEKEVKAGVEWTELTAAEDLENYRSTTDSWINYYRGSSFSTISSAGSNGAIIHYSPNENTDKQITKDTVYLLDSGGQYLNQSDNRGLSFNSISGSGSNGAIIHYSVSNNTDKPITTGEMYLLDSGGQYLDGTTDITRTFHFGTPTAYQKECYTRVLMGHIDLFQSIWPKGLYGREIDAFARRALWDVGLVYRHGTGHGIGMYLSVHEEPGYYEAGEFGIRLENIVMVVNATTKYKFPGTHFLTFEHITLVPYEPNLIEYDMLSDKQIQYLNDYHQLCRERVGPEIQRSGNTEGYEWLMKKSAMYTRSRTGESSGVNYISVQACAILIPFLMFIISSF